MRYFRQLECWTMGRGDIDAPGFFMVDWDQWCENPKDNFAKGIRIESGDEIIVSWPDGSKTIESLLIQEYTRNYEHDNGYGVQTNHPISVGSAYFETTNRGVRQVFSLRHNKDIKFKRNLPIDYL